MVNRTAKPLSIQSISEYNALGLKTGDLTQAYFGDGAGHFEVTADVNFEQLGNGLSTSHYGKYWIRFSAGTDGNGNTAFSQPIPALRSSNCNPPFRTNLPLLVSQRQTDKQWVIQQVDVERMAAAGDNPNALNILNPTLWQIWLEKIRNFRLLAPSTDDTPSTLVTIEPLLYQFDGSLYNAGKTTSDNINLSGYIPTNGTERLVAIGERAYDGSIQIVSGNTRAISTANYSLSDVQVLTYQFQDMVMINRAVRLANDAGMVREKDLYLDLRQFVNVPEPRGFPQTIQRHIHIMENYQQPFSVLAVGDGGVLQVDGLLYEVG